MRLLINCEVGVELEDVKQQVGFRSAAQPNSSKPGGFLGVGMIVDGECCSERLGMGK